jgi:oligoribonuclease (3'-5' exoribonuclease)
VNPFELHPDDKKRISEKKEKSTITLADVKKIIVDQINQIKREASPMWGYSIEHVGSFFYELIRKIESNTGEKDDS